MPKRDPFHFLPEKIQNRTRDFLGWFVATSPGEDEFREVLANLLEFAYWMGCEKGWSDHDA